MKVCSRCKIEKDDGSFHKRGAGFQDRCKECKRLSIREHYQANKQYYLDKAKKSKEQGREITQSVRKQPCTDCKKEYPYYVMDFDHINPVNKVDNVGSMINSGLPALRREIAKCEVVCANCHRERTFQRHQRIASVS